MPEIHEYNAAIYLQNAEIYGLKALHSIHMCYKYCSKSAYTNQIYN